MTTWRVKAYIEYEIEAKNKEEAILRMGEVVFTDLNNDINIEEIAEVTATKIEDNNSDE